MGKLLTILGVSEEVQSKLPESVFKAEKMVDLLQSTYANAPESGKKDQLAMAISESVRILMAKVQPYMVDEKKEEKIEEEEKKLPEEPRMPESPKAEKPETEKPKKGRKQKATPPPTSPEPPKPEAPEKPKEVDTPHKATEEPMTCQEIKDAIKGLNLIAKMGDTEAASFIKELKIKLKNQNCK